MGSPPHTWRIQNLQIPVNPKDGITSTYVENTNLDDFYSSESQDHLHIRGEYRDLNRNKDFRAGSPPHTWRILVLQEQSYTRLRITSTYVENTVLIAVIAKWKRDHLHIRREYAKKLKRLQRAIGSPPHTWRILPDHMKDLQNLGITSTYVENTLG